jgi:hypothetical protein
MIAPSPDPAGTSNAPRKRVPRHDLIGGFLRRLRIFGFQEECCRSSRSGNIEFFLAVIIVAQRFRAGFGFLLISRLRPPAHTRGRLLLLAPALAGAVSISNFADGEGEFSICRP